MPPADRPSVLFRVALAALLVVPASCAVFDSFEPESLPLPADPSDYAPLAGYEAMAVPADNPITPEKAHLGRQLYHDARLSGPGNLSCYSCHRTELGLTDGLAVSIGAAEEVADRSSPTVWNIGFHEFWFWDGSADTLERQAALAWRGPYMAVDDPQAVLSRLDAHPGYRSQFELVFGEPASEENVAAALATYMRTLISTDTAWDRYRAGDDDALTEAQERGWETFQRIGCNACHAGALLTDLQFHNVGIGIEVDEPDVGRGKISLRNQDRGAFKTPTLRDIGKSAPYFHDGSVETLEEAVRMMMGKGLPALWMQQASPEFRPVDLDDEDFADLMAFLSALDQPEMEWALPPDLPPAR